MRVDVGRRQAGDRPQRADQRHGDGRVPTLRAAQGVVDLEAFDVVAREADQAGGRPRVLIEHVASDPVDGRDVEAVEGGLVPLGPAHERRSLPRQVRRRSSANAADSMAGKLPAASA